VIDSSFAALESGAPIFINFDLCRRQAATRFAAVADGALTGVMVRRTFIKVL